MGHFYACLLVLGRFIHSAARVLFLWGRRKRLALGEGPLAWLQVVGAVQFSLLARFSTKLRGSFGAKYGVYWMPICSQLLGTTA